MLWINGASEVSRELWNQEPEGIALWRVLTLQNDETDLHTSSVTAAWALLHLADHSEIVEELYQEQVKHFSTPDDTLCQSTDELQKIINGQAHAFLPRLDDVDIEISHLFCARSRLRRGCVHTTIPRSPSECRFDTNAGKPLSSPFSSMTQRTQWGHSHSLVPNPQTV
ncbi:hypothetical protein EDB85DRAFT_2241683 [Lactarius pseudohatsudake]|nr:hypothetical protein EDB85DRAFT_2241683 [Lactarius pseudohatsudake]